jgi:predicted component of type VI protein secretion system
MAITNTRLTTTDSTEVFRAAEDTAITTVYICNTTANPVTVQVYLIADDGSSGGSDLNTIYSDLEVTAHDTYVMNTEKLVLGSDDYMEVEANVSNSITVTVSSIAI